MTLTEAEAGDDLLPRLITGDVEGDARNDDAPDDRYHITANTFEWMATVCTRLADALKR